MVRSGILSTPEKRFKKFKVHYAWIYLTERCNLHCDYCFFKFKRAREISGDAVEKLFLLFEQHSAPKTLIFSGGEPFLAKKNLFKILALARERFRNISLHIQTNGLLIDRQSISRLAHLRVSLEFGIDGGSQATIRHRRGLKPASFRKLLETIRICLKSGIGCGCTMTMHPHELARMQEGVRFLSSLGMGHIDVTPAAFMPWTPELVGIFKKNYLALAHDAQARRIMYVKEDTKNFGPDMMDLSLHPPGYLLGGDPFLCLPENKRVEFNLWDPSNGQLHSKMLSYYQDFYKGTSKESSPQSYREYVCHGFELVNKMMGWEYINTWAINDIMLFLKKTHLALARKRVVNA